MWDRPLATEWPFLDLCSWIFTKSSHTILWRNKLTSDLFTLDPVNSCTSANSQKWIKDCKTLKKNNSLLLGWTTSTWVKISLNQRTRHLWRTRQKWSDDGKETQWVKRGEMELYSQQLQRKLNTKACKKTKTSLMLKDVKILFLVLN